LEKHLHIISFDVPYPADYGGAIDIFYTIQALQSAGVSIHLHCFEDNREKEPELNNYCSDVIYYQRRCGHKGFSHVLPYVVGSRSNPELLENLLKDDYPILMYGIHCTYLLLDKRFTNRKVFLRPQQIMYRLYKKLSQLTLSPFKKLYYLHESKLLKQYETEIATRARVIAISDHDRDVYRSEFNAQQVITIPSFLPYKEINSQEGVGCFCLYHGNLGSEENEKAAMWLLKKVFSGLPVHFIIAGKNPSEKLEQAVLKQPTACLVANPSHQEMQDLINQAQINVLPSMYNKSVHTKLLNALFNGRHCIVNDEMIRDSILAPSCHVATTADAFQSVITQLYHHPFEDHEIQLRKHLLSNYYNTEKNTSLLMNIIWG
jgi:hypothetical protein